ncbi:host-nuclease inhibitor Gam family protein [uncultured Phascolarctobacterium sp.]|uniref:host-nuclease inhibitor Gam family protein n=1 Tax=uncultured Phascolarctobacterium sp. TaxID=512296 RepID=UPI0025CFF0F3|nr:host-nuclease inhibitor Gam family protein [uncultured Phascolarctobacterium sp.]
MARVRIKEEGLQSWEEVDQHLRRLGEIGNRISRLEADYNDKVTELKGKVDEKVKPLILEKEQLERQIKDYAECNRLDLNGKTKVMTFGQLGFRQSTSIIVRKAAAVIKALKEKGLTGCINIRESVNKDELRKQTDDVISAVGAVKKVEDVFWYEPDFEKLNQ